MRSIQNLTSLKGKRVLVRVDFNVPLNKTETCVADDSRIVEAMPTIKHLLRAGATVYLVAHFKRPEGKVAEDMRLNVVARHLGNLFNRKATDIPRLSIGEFEAYHVTGRLYLLENIRFYAAEDSKDKQVRDRFGKRLAALADMYVDDAFGNAHRNHASMTSVPKYLPGYAGLLLADEVRNLSKAVASKKHPSVAIIGGAKISTKIGLIKSFIGRVDHIILGGALANTILQAQGVSIGKSLVEKDMVRMVGNLDYATSQIEIPVDAILTKDVEGKKGSRIDAVGNIKSDELIVDIGPDTLALYSDIVSRAKLIIWNGPMGVFEVPKFAKGTLGLVRAVTASKADVYVGGGETVEAVKQLGLEKKITWVSTGGGAMLEFLETGGKLPAIMALG